MLPETPLHNDNPISVSALPVVRERSGNNRNPFAATGLKLSDLASTQRDQTYSAPSVAQTVNLGQEF